MKELRTYKDMNLAENVGLRLKNAGIDYFIRQTEDESTNEACWVIYVDEKDYKRALNVSQNPKYDSSNGYNSNYSENLLHRDNDFWFYRLIDKINKVVWPIIIIGAPVVFLVWLFAFAFPGCSNNKPAASDIEINDTISNVDENVISEINDTISKVDDIVISKHDLELDNRENEVKVLNRPPIKIDAPKVKKNDNGSSKTLRERVEENRAKYRNSTGENQ